MLTLQPRMDRMGRSPDLLTAVPNLIRQPSAEDLDAAHQLVSSARGGRSGVSRIDERPRTEDERRPFPDDSPTHLAAGLLATNGQSTLLGQVCRCEIHVPSSMWGYC